MDEPPAVAIDPVKRAELERQIDSYVRSLGTLHPRSPAFHETTALLADIGRSEASELARLTERYLDQRREASLQAHVVGAVTQLRRVLSELDPARHAHLLSDRYLFGLVPLRARTDEYFARFVKARASIESALSDLARGRDDLHQSAIAIEAQRAGLRDALQRLALAIETARLLGPRLEVTAREVSDQVLAAALRDAALPTVVQREADLLERMTLGVQGEMALGVIADNASALIALADKALATAMTALRTAVVAARVLAQQDLVFRNIGALQAAASNLIEQGEDGSPGTQIEALQRAFAEVHNAIDEAAAFQDVAGAALAGNLSGLEPSGPPGR